MSILELKKHLLLGENLILLYMIHFLKKELEGIFE